MKQKLLLIRSTFLMILLMSSTVKSAGETSRPRGFNTAELCGSRLQVTRRKIEADSLDPPKLTLRRKLIKMKETIEGDRRHAIDQLEAYAQNGGEVLLRLLQDVQRLKDGNSETVMPWGIFGPVQGNADRHLDVLIGRIVAFDEVLALLKEVMEK